MVVHITTQGAQIVREGRHLLVRKEGDIHHTLFPHKLVQLVLYGEVGITSSALKFLLREGIDVVFLRRDGRYLGRLAPREPKNVFLRKKQFDLVDNLGFRLGLARAFVRGKLHNMAVVLRRIRRARHDDSAGHAAKEILEWSELSTVAESLEALRGVEGSGSAVYFAALRHGFEHDHGFRKRVRRPPTDPVNAVLSLLYTLLVNRTNAAVRLAGLDPYPGMLHELDYGRHSLALDIVEEFRPMIADTLTLALFNLRVLQAQDFLTLEPAASQPAGDMDENMLDAAVRHPLGQMNLQGEKKFFDIPEQRMNSAGPPSDGKRPIRLTPEALPRVVQAFEKKMASEIHNPVADEHQTFAEALVSQARQVRQVIEGTVAEYQPILLR